MNETGRKQPVDKRRRVTKPVFYNIDSGWIRYVGWVMGRLKMVVKRMQREQMEQARRLTMFPGDINQFEQTYQTATGDVSQLD